MDTDNRMAVQTSYCYTDDYPKQLKELYITDAEMKFRKGLVDYLWEHRTQRLCVSIKETREQQYPQEIYTITCDVVVVDEYPIKLRMPSYEDMSWKSLSNSALAEIRCRLRRWFAGDK